MRKRSRVLAGILAAVLVVGTLAGCGGDKKEGGEGGSSASGSEKVFTYNGGSVVVGLNPILNTTAPDNEAHGLICEPLVRNIAREGNTTEIVPAGAESWDVSEDGMTYTFHMHEGAKWSDGEPYTANDFEYTLKLMADPATAAANAWLFDGVIVNFGEALYENGKTPDEIAVKATDDYTLEITLTHPASYFLELVSSLYPVRQDKYEEWGDSYGSSAEKIICSGPFKVESWNQNTEMVVVKNENYWNVENIKLDKIVQKVIQETATAVQAFINGEIDVTSTSDPNWQQTIESSDMSTIETVPGNAPEFLMFNLQDEYLCNTKIRQALSIAFDRQAFVDDLRDGQAVGIYSVMPDTMMVGDKPYTEMVDGKNYIIKQMQEEYTDPKALLIEGLEELGKPADPSLVTINYASRGTNEFSKKMAEWYKQTWETNLGINVEIDMMEWNIMWDKIDAGDFDIAVGGWGPYYNEPSAVLTLFDPVNGYFNADKIGWTDETATEFKALCDAATNTVDDQEKADIYLKAEEILLRNAIISPEYLGQSPSYIANYVEGYCVATLGQQDWTKVTVNK
ncbi:MAG: peptide ABC transporter substrate-binding protein [Bariatricus sp.]